MAAASGDFQALDSLQIGTRSPIQPYGERYIFLLRILMEETGGITGGCNLHLAGNIVFGDAVDGNLFLVDRQAVFRLIVFNVPVDIDNTFRLSE
jgi:hypothetical protein